MSSSTSGSAYAQVKPGRLRLKGDSSKRPGAAGASEADKAKQQHESKRRRKRKAEAAAAAAEKAKDPADTASHGGWWSVSNLEEITGGNLAIELDSHTYLAALDNGRFAVGPTHRPGEGPTQEEVLVAVRLPDGRLGLKSGYGKFLGLDSADRLVGLADAMGPRELWQPVFQDGRTAVLGANGCFLGLHDELGLACRSQRVSGDAELVTLRCNANLDVDPKLRLAPEERQGAVQAEVNYARKFQSWQDGRLRLSGEDKADLKRARRDGYLHESMLDRREKQKSDKFCK